MLIFQPNASLLAEIFPIGYNIPVYYGELQLAYRPRFGFPRWKLIEHAKITYQSIINIPRDIIIILNIFSFFFFFFIFFSPKDLTYLRRALQNPFYCHYCFLSLFMIQTRAYTQSYADICPEPKMYSTLFIYLFIYLFTFISYKRLHFFY